MYPSPPSIPLYIYILQLPISLLTPTTTPNKVIEPKEEEEEEEEANNKMTCSSSLTLLSKTTVYPSTKSTMPNMKLSVSDLPMLSCHYIQKGLLFPLPLIPVSSLLSLLQLSLSHTLTHFPPLTGRLVTDATGFIQINCNDAGVTFIHADATQFSVDDILSPFHVPDFIQQFFAFQGSVSYYGHSKPLLAVQVTELSDGVFIGCTANHSVMDGTSFWKFFNTFAEVTRGADRISRPDFTRNFFQDSKAVIKFPDGPPKVTFDVDAPLKERIFHFSREAILQLKSRANFTAESNNTVEMMGKMSNDKWLLKSTEEISSFQSLCAQLWRSITRARKFPASKLTTFRMAVNCRHRLQPQISPNYFGNAIQSIPTVASTQDVLSQGLRWIADLLHKNVVAYDDATIRGVVENWEKNPRVFPLGNFDGGVVTMGSSPRFPMYDNNFGWGRPLAVRSGSSNKFDGKISAFPGKECDGSVDLEVCLSPETMAGLESDAEFMQYVSKNC